MRLARTYRLLSSWPLGVAWREAAREAALEAEGCRSAATKDVLGNAFDASSTEQFAGLGGGGAGNEDFVDGGDLLNLYYAGDFCSPRPPGVVAAALSGKHAAEACAQRMCK